MTDEQLRAKWLKTNKPKVFPAPKDTCEPYSGLVLKTNIHTEVKYNQWGQRIWNNLGKTFITDVDESVRDFGE